MKRDTLHTASKLAMGTVALGMPYGIASEGKVQRLPRKAAIRLLHQARDAGITLFDTAPGYGESESIVGDAFAGDSKVVIATKVDGLAYPEAITSSIDNSLKVLKRECLDIVQIHNATPQLLQNGETVELLRELQQSGKIGKVGASVYGVQAADAVLDAGMDVLQMACNLLDQRMRERVIPQAEHQGVQLLIRSVFLKGLLTEWGQSLHGDMESHRQAVSRVIEQLQCGWGELAELALRFALSCGGQGSVLIGVTTEKELKTAISAEQKGILPKSLQAIVDSMGIVDDRILNPSLWPNSEQLDG